MTKGGVACQLIHELHEREVVRQAYPCLFRGVGRDNFHSYFLGWLTALGVRLGYTAAPDISFYHPSTADSGKLKRQQARRCDTLWTDRESGAPVAIFEFEGDSLDSGKLRQKAESLRIHYQHTERQPELLALLYWHPVSRGGSDLTPTVRTLLYETTIQGMVYAPVSCDVLIAELTVRADSSARLSLDGTYVRRWYRPSAWGDHPTIHGHCPQVY